MDIKDLKAKTAEQLKELLIEVKKEAFNLRFQLAAGELEKTHRIGELRKTVAQIKTLLTEVNKGEGNA